MWYHRSFRRFLAGSLVGLALLLVAGCNVGADQEEPTEEPESVEDFVPVVSATGEVVPVQKAVLSFPLDGQVVEVAVEEGMAVRAGDVLARLDSALLDADVARAEAALAIAQANLDRVRSGPRPQEIEQARRNLAAANARVAEAAARREDVAAGASEAEILAAQRDLENARIALQQAQNQYDVAIGWAINADPDYQASLPEEARRTSPEDERHTRAQLEAASQNLAAAQAYLEDLLDGPSPDELRIADARVWAAAAERDVIQAQLDLLLAGPLAEDIAVAEADVARAEAQLEAALARREQATLLAPFDGTVTAVLIRQGEWAQGGQGAIEIADLTALRVETTDLNEIDVARIEVGSHAIVTFDALPGVEVNGRVIRIAPMAAEGSGVNYTVTVELDEIPPAVRWGMTAFVDIEAE